MEKLTIYEVKWKGKISPKDFRNLLPFVKNLNLQKGYVLTPEKVAIEKNDGMDMIFLPVWIL
ncbi:MAG: hypothetical protein ACPL28_08115 [bacterium]